MAVNRLPLITSLCEELPPKGKQQSGEACTEGKTQGGEACPKGKARIMRHNEYAESK